MAAGWTEAGQGLEVPSLPYLPSFRRQCQEHTRSSSAAATYTLFRWVKPGRTKLFEVPLSYIIAEEDIPRPNVYGPRFVLQKGV